MRRIMASLDLGTGSIKLVVGEMIKQKLNVLAALEVPSKGIKKGLVVNPDLLTDAIKMVFKKAEAQIGLKIKSTIVTLPAESAEFSVVDGEVKIINEDGIVRGNDIARVLQNATKGKIPDNMEVVSLLPSYFRIGEQLLRDPKNKKATSIAVKAVLILIPKKIAYPFLECLANNNIEIIDLALSSLGDYYEYKNNEMENKVGAIVNIGATTTTLSVFNKGVLTNCEVIDLGGQNVDNDISFIYKFNQSDAKYLKENLALAHKHAAQASLCEEITNKLGTIVKINQYELSEIVMSRINEILNLAKKQINHLTKKEISYIIFTGGLTESQDFPLILKEIFGHNAKIGHITEVGARSNQYSSCLGLIKYYDYKANLKDKDYAIFSPNEEEDLGGLSHKITTSEGSILSKLFGYFFDN